MNCQVLAVALVLRLCGGWQDGPSSAGTRRRRQSLDAGIIPEEVLDRQKNFVFPILPDGGPDVTPALPLPANALFRLEDLRRVSTDLRKVYSED